MVALARQRSVLGTEAAADVREDVVDLLANDGKDDDDDDSDENEDERVLNHALAFLVLILVANHELAKSQIEIAEHSGVHLLFPGICVAFVGRGQPGAEANYGAGMFHEDGQSAKAP